MTISLTKDTIKVGMRVRCIFIPIKFGKIGTVIDINTNNRHRICITWDDKLTDNCVWGEYNSFESIEGICIQDCCRAK